MNRCLYLGNEVQFKVHACGLHGKCTVQEFVGAGLPCCETCKDHITLDSEELPAKWKDPLNIMTRDRIPTKVLHNLIAGRSAFLVCGGPSANKLELEQLNRRGSFSLCINNVAGHARFRPQAFCCSDPPMKFSSSIWLDPGIMKFVPSPKLTGSRSKIRKKEGDQFKYLPQRITEAPNVWAFERRSWMAIDETFFTEPSAAWGNQKVGVEKTGEAKTACTMLIGMRLLYYLGARRIFLIGADFIMDEKSGYSFAQARDAGAAESNNRQFSVVNDWLVRLQQRNVFKTFGLEIYNCFDRSGLRAFQYCPFDVAVEDVCRDVEKEPDLAHWYEKVDKVSS